MYKIKDYLELLHKRGLSDTDIGRQSKPPLKQPTISRIRRGKIANPGLETMRAIVEGQGHTLDDIKDVVKVTKPKLTLTPVEEELITLLRDLPTKYFVRFHRAATLMVMAYGPTTGDKRMKDLGWMVEKEKA